MLFRNLEWQMPLLDVFRANECGKICTLITYLQTV